MLIPRLTPKLLLNYVESSSIFLHTTTRQYIPHKVAGDPLSQAKIFNDNFADELIVININPESTPFDKFLESIKMISESTFMPLSVGGGIDSLIKAKQVFECGVERVLIGRAIFDQPSQIELIASNYGSQSLIGSVDYWGGYDSQGVSLLENKMIVSADRVPEMVKLFENSGVGELLLNDVSRDGTRAGSNIEILGETLGITNLPIIDSCGLGNVSHFVNSLRCGSSAVASGTFFAFTDQSFIQLKNHIINSGIQMRVR